MQDLLHNILAKHTGQTTERIADDFDRDYFMDPDQAEEYGIIDEVLRPEAKEEAEQEAQVEGETEQKEETEE
jgi:ATP-dependent Clp protease protease subunit